MKSDKGGELIEVWRPRDLPQLELRRGFAVTTSVPRHWHEEYQLCVIQSGTGELKYRGGNVLNPPGSFYIIHPGEVHATRSCDSFGCNYRTLYMNAELMRGAATELFGRDLGAPCFPAAAVFDNDLIKQYLDLFLSLERPSSSLERQTLLQNLLAGLILRLARGRPSPQHQGLERQAVSRARDYLVEHYAENVTLKALARIANLSAFHFTRVFSAQTGMPPHSFQIQLRVSRAKALLRQHCSIQQVASQTGFADQSHLTRHFKRLVGVTPGAYARNSKNVQDAPGKFC